MTNGGIRNVACSPVMPGSQTGTTSTHSNSGCNAQTPLCCWTHPGGRARLGRSRGGCGSQSARCPKAARTRLGDAYAMSGDWPLCSCVSAIQSPIGRAPSSLSMGGTWLCICSVQKERYASSSTVSSDPRRAVRCDDAGIHVSRALVNRRVICEAHLPRCGLPVNRWVIFDDRRALAFVVDVGTGRIGLVVSSVGEADGVHGVQRPTRSRIVG